MRLRTVVATLALVGSASLASAGENNVPVQTASKSGSAVPVTQVAQGRVIQQDRRIQGGFLNRLMELERRKNAWLRRTFTR
jgi:hypothetical protein